MPIPRGQKGVQKVMREYKAKKLHSGKNGPVVKSKKQAVAIALSEAGMAKNNSSNKKKNNASKSRSTGPRKPAPKIVRTGEEGPKRSTPRVTPGAAMNRGAGVGTGITRRAAGTPTTRVSPARRQENLPKPKVKKKTPPKMGAGVPGFGYGRYTI